MRKRVSFLVVVAVGAFLGAPVARAVAQNPAQATSPGGEMAFRAIFGGAATTCALNAAGEAFCWGGDGFGQLGAPAPDTCSYKDGREKVTTPCAMKPLAVQGGLRFVSLALGNLHTCGLTADGVAYCWGDNSFGQLAVDSVGERCREHNLSLPCSHAPVPVSGGFRFTQLGAGRFHTCGLLADGTVRCWGLNANGQLGTAEALRNCSMDQPGLPAAPCSRKPVPVALELRAMAIAAGLGHNCALGADSLVVCWGLGFAGAPKSIPGNHRFVRLVAGGFTTCGVGPDDVPWCWGLAKRFPGMISGGGDTPEKGGTWLSDPDDPRFPVLAVGGLHICGLVAGGQAFCWGRHEEGQLGIKRPVWRRMVNPNLQNDPAEVEGELRFVALAAGSAHTCGVTAEGRAYCWGVNVEGQLGDGTTKQHKTPAPVLTGAAAVAQVGTQP
jgi:alpha-tubulin suppressor-like RCC1 family protein